MTRFLLDTNLCINFMRGRQWARNALASVQVPDVAVSVVTVGVLHEGAHRSDSPARDMAKTEQFLKPLAMLPYGREEAMQWGLIEARLHKAGQPIEAEDSMIAATAIVHGLTLVTGNTKHFERVKGLKVVDWERHPPEG